MTFSDLNRQDDLSRRFWAKVDRSSDCWIWTAHKDRYGYGRIAVNGRAVTASRVSWQLTNGEIPDGQSICHRCDNPSCVRPEHLFLGSPKDNYDDSRGKGRAFTGRRLGSDLSYCKKGLHKMLPGSYYVTSQGLRHCRECHRAAQRKVSR